jgi:hypothetical protein
MGMGRNKQSVASYVRAAGVWLILILADTIVLRTTYYDTMFRYNHHSIFLLLAQILLLHCMYVQFYQIQTYRQQIDT